MKSKILSPASSASTNSTSSSSGAFRFVQKFTHAAAVRARYPVPPLGSLWDPYLLDRLQTPLTRYRD